jgi:hypothetical protein
MKVKLFEIIRTSRKRKNPVTICINISKVLSLQDQPLDVRKSVDFIILTTSGWGPEIPAGTWTRIAHIYASLEMP